MCLLVISSSELRSLKLPVSCDLEPNVVCKLHHFNVFLFFFVFVMTVDESEDMQARPVYVAAVDLSCKWSFN